MAQRNRVPLARADRPVTWRDLTVYTHGVVTALVLHGQVGWPTTTAAAVGLTGPVLWELLRGQR
ncbi:hypothetical protein [Kitasatospora sp. NBC_00458]|uniref:hypothetical protein n=1 Tax=Kitasatospora sp. NBC_00458 TaxID=2903568 RepID=UPI002E18B74B